MSSIWNNNGSTLKASTISSVGSGNSAEVCISERLKEEMKRYIVEELFSNEDSADLLNITINYLRKELEKIMDNPEMIVEKGEYKERLVNLENKLNTIENRLYQLQEAINSLNDRLRKLEFWSSHVQSILSSSPNTPNSPNSPNITWSTSSTGPQC